MTKAQNDLATMSIIELQARKTNLQLTLGQTNSNLTDLQVKMHSLAHEISRIEAEVSRRLRPAVEPRLSDHAVLRFVERVYGFNMEDIKARIMTPAVVKAIHDGATAVTVEGVRFKIADNTIVTAFIPDAKKVKVKKTREVNDMQEQIDEYFEKDEV